MWFVLPVSNIQEHLHFEVVETELQEKLPENWKEVTRLQADVFWVLEEVWDDWDDWEELAIACSLLKYSEVKENMWDSLLFWLQTSLVVIVAWAT